jgi:hypothetical protein
MFKMTVWLTIDHAKKDGTLYDLWVRYPDGDGRRVTDAKFTQPGGLPFPAWCSYTADSRNVLVPVMGQVTHCMKIPEPPVNTGEKR